MIFGVPREIRAHEYRVGALPFLVKELVRRGHQVLVEAGAGESCKATDSQYEQAGATVVPSSEKLYSQVDVILKVREPMSVEFDLIKPDQIIMSFFHFANRPELAKSLAARGCTCLAYEMVEEVDHSHPITLPISMISGKMAVINGAYFLQKPLGGAGTLLGHLMGNEPARVVILGSGNVGQQAAITAAQLGANVFVLDTDYHKLQNLDLLGYNNITTLFSNDDNIRELLPETDLLIACVQVPQESPPKIVTREMVKTMREGSVIVDVDIDMGGSVETSKATNHDNPTFAVDGVIHYCVPNISAGVPVAASRALSAALTPYLIRIAEVGFEDALLSDPVLASGLVIYKGFVVKERIAQLCDLPVADLVSKIEEFREK